MKSFDVVVLGSGPGGYVAAIRAAQLGLAVAIVEKREMGGVCLNRGCIPSKAVLKAASIVHRLKHFGEMGIDVELKGLDGGKAVVRAKKISAKISKGVEFLMKKNSITVLRGLGHLESERSLSVETVEGKQTINFQNLIIATGAKYRSFPGLVHDGKRLIGAWEATQLEKLPSSVGIIGAGAIGVEFAYFWNAFGVQVELFELQPRLLPLEDEECSRELEKYYKKYGIRMSLGVKDISARNTGQEVAIEYTLSGKKQKSTFDMALIAVGMVGVSGGFGLEKLGIEKDGDFIKVNDRGQTNLSHIYAVGDVSGPPLLAHAASHEGIIAAEHIAGLEPRPIDKKNIPACTYCSPQVASVGHTERELMEKGVPYKVGKIPFSANGKALAGGEAEGFIKVLMGEHGQMLGAHIVSPEASELIHEYTLFKTMEGIDEEIYSTIHPHPTLGEWLSEAVMAAKNRALHF
ncbi:MAG: dihydrolipoyl dehydrogenase [Bacteriovoracales bacterium]|nr:dihydrolipoyl dehydrogenase [Bacteriovoracales bacterium]